MNWIALTSVEQLDQIKSASANKAQVIFKHSTRCSISSVAKNRLERGTPPQDADFYYLDLLNNREISNQIAAEFDVFHESPQVLIIRNGDCIYDESHSGINLDDIADQVATVS